MQKVSREKIERLREKIQKSETAINEHRAKIKAWQKNISELEDEERKIYAEKFLQVIADNGLTNESDKKDFLAEIEKIAKQKAAAKNEKQQIEAVAEIEQTENSDKINNDITDKNEKNEQSD